MPSIPVAHSVILRETYENLSFIVEHISCNEHEWLICVDLMVVAILNGLQTGYTKFMCFLCKWDSRARSEHYICSAWPPQDSVLPGSHNIIHEPLVNLSIVGKFVPILPVSWGGNFSRWHENKCSECQCGKQASLLHSQLFPFPSIVLTG